MPSYQQSEDQTGSSPRVREGKRILIIAGPNGAGKTTFAQEFLPREASCPEFVNADLIAAGLSPFQPGRVPIAAGRIMLNRLRGLTASGVNFAFETTLATGSYRRLMPQWQSAGYHVVLYFLKLPNPEMAIRRVARRVEQGGHDIPAITIRRRFHRGWENLRQDYLGLVDEWFIYDAARNPARLIEHGLGPPTNPLTVMEDSAPTQPVSPNPNPESLMNSAGADAAFKRAAIKIIERDRALGLEPIVSEEYESDL